MMNAVLYDVDNQTAEKLKTMLHRFFGRMNYVEVCSQKISQTAAVLYGQEVDMVFADISMSESKGMKFLQAVKETNDKIPCVAFSQYEHFEYLQDAIRIGVLDFLVKPVNEKELNLVIQKLERQVYNEKKKETLVLPILESGFISNVLLRDEEESEWSVYKKLLGIQEDYGYIIVIEYGDEIQGRKMTNPIGTGVELQRKYDKFREMIHQYFHKAVVGTPFSNRMILYVPYERESMEYDVQFQIVETAQKMLGELEEKERLRVKIGIGNVQSMKSIQISYKEAMLALKQPYENVVHANAVHSFPAYESGYPLKTEEEIFLAIKQGDVQKVQTQSEVFFKWMVEKEGRLSDNMRLKCLEFVLRAETIGYFEGGGTYCFESRKEYLNEVFACSAMEEMEKWFLRKMKEAGDTMGSNQKKLHAGVVGQAEKYVKEHFNQEITLNKIAGELNVNANYFSRLFKDETGINFLDYLMKIRVEQAEKRLKNSKQSIKEIGMECGYADQNYFSRVFKKITGISPIEYRKKQLRTVYPDG